MAFATNNLARMWTFFSVLAGALFFGIEGFRLPCSSSRMMSSLLSMSTPERPDSFRGVMVKNMKNAGHAIAAGIALGGLKGAAQAAPMDAASKVVLPPLPYGKKDLEPFISEKTLFFHHDKHHAKYVETTVKMIEGTPLQNADLVTIMKDSHKVKPVLFNNAAQAWNHEFYWNCMKKGGGGEPNGRIAAAINKSFGSYDEFKKQFVAAGNTQFGSGWAWLVQNKDGSLEVLKSTGAENPIVDGKQPLLTMDVWEHAYYLDYQNMRGTYVDAFMNNLVNWDHVEKQLGKKA